MAGRLFHCRHVTIPVLPTKRRTKTGMGDDRLKDLRCTGESLIQHQQAAMVVG